MGVDFSVAFMSDTVSYFIVKAIQSGGLIACNLSFRLIYMTFDRADAIVFVYVGRMLAQLPGTICPICILLWFSFFNFFSLLVVLLYYRI